MFSISNDLCVQGILSRPRSCSRSTSPPTSFTSQLSVYAPNSWLSCSLTLCTVGGLFKNMKYKVCTRYSSVDLPFRDLPMLYSSHSFATISSSTTTSCTPHMRPASRRLFPACRHASSPTRSHIHWTRQRFTLACPTTVTSVTRMRREWLMLRTSRSQLPSFVSVTHSV